MDKNAKIVRLRVDTLDAKNFPIDRVTLREPLVDDWSELLAQIREHTPDASPETLLRAVILYGTRAVAQLLAKKQVFAVDGVVRPPAALKGRGAAAALRAS